MLLRRKILCCDWFFDWKVTFRTKKGHALRRFLKIIIIISIYENLMIYSRGIYALFLDLLEQSHLISMMIRKEVSYFS